MSIEAKPEDRDANYTAPDAPVQEDQRVLLCYNCAQLDFGKIRQRNVHEYDFHNKVMDLSDRTSLLASNCPLCQLFGATVQENSGLCLRVYQSSLGSPGETRSNILGVATDGILETDSSLYTKGHLAIESNQGDTRSFNTRLINPGAFNLDFARDCWEYCSSNHVATCSRTNAYHSYPFKVIDCLSRTIIDAPKHCKYAALSYVWGNISSTTHTEASNRQKDSLSLSNLPKTIEDSIIVTRGMSLRYLWVDRYCINQSDHGAKDVQIKQMDAIYSLAELTIVAASGDDPNHGLPGVNGTERTEKQQSICLGEYCIRQTLPPARLSVSKSIWSTRAWTYQESVLSRRRLIFTSHQVFFECKKMLCSESLNIPLDTASLIYLDENWSTYYSINNPQRTIVGLVDGISSVWECIEEYCNRKLSFHEDKLNAMRGILEAARKGHQPVYHLSGLPVLETGHNLNTAQQFLLNLGWGNEDILERVTTLPSWSWAGWYAGRLSKPNLLPYKKYEMLRNVMDIYENAGYSQPLDNEDWKGVVWIETQYSLIEYPSDQKSAIELLTSLDDIRFIHIRTWAIHCRFVAVEDGQSSTYSVKFMLKQHETTEYFVRFSREMTASNLERLRQEPGSLLAMVLPKVDCRYGIFVLLVEDMGEHYERLGCVYLYDSVDKKAVTLTWRDLMSGPKRTIRLG